MTETKMKELLEADPPIVFYTDSYAERPLRRSQFSTAAKFRSLRDSEGFLSNKTSYRAYVSHRLEYAIYVQDIGGGSLKFARTLGESRKEFRTAQDAISDLLDVIAEWSVSND